MKFNNKESECIEHKGKKYWISRSVAVFGVIFFEHEEETKVLITQRGEKCPDEVGKWCLPCGYLDWNESGPEALIREVYEETKINLYDFEKKPLFNHLFKSNPLFVESNLYDHKQNVSLGYCLHANLEKDLDLSFRSEEVSDIQLVSIADINKMEFAFGHDKRIHEALSILASQVK